MCHRGWPEVWPILLYNSTKNFRFQSEIDFFSVIHGPVLSTGAQEFTADDPFPIDDNVEST